MILAKETVSDRPHRDRLQNPALKYSAFPKLHPVNRKWPEKSITKPPRWLSTDLRDGNQALPQPMDSDAKFRYFQSLLKYGYKEIEISYPSASQTEYDFTRRLILCDAVPDDVWIQVMAPCREELIRTTIESVRGAKKVILHLHLSTSACFREIVFNMTPQETINLAVRCAKLYRELTTDSGDPEMMRTEWTLEFTPENFQDTSVEFALQICEAVKEAWQPTVENKIIFNLTSTVEVAMPNIFADQVEAFCDNISEREKVCVSLHNHNDRGCAVATSELSQLAGADRVEGCIFGNGERTGNVDLVTLALNLYTQGIHPGIDFGDINQVVNMVEELTKIPLHYRAPYAGRLTFCTFTGTHQDAIRKGYKVRTAAEEKTGQVVPWRMPYLPMDPADLNRKHEAIIRINSQSGKGGIAWFVHKIFNIDMPRGLELDFTKLVKTYADSTGIEIMSGMIEDLFRSYYMLPISSQGKSIRWELECPEVTAALDSSKGGSGKSNDEYVTNVTVMRLEKIHGIEIEVLDRKTQTIGKKDGFQKTAKFIQLRSKGRAAAWGVGLHEEPTLASLQAVRF
ncbi:2-isopropylmalate synthase protein [Rutstroemia sp. NJR-2017a WRK4]|nr:2-isopropylmalate synthase protein [Rutstroemia sp. NJR-2017a WRK4]